MATLLDPVERTPSVRVCWRKVPLKYVALGVLVVQTSTMVLVLRYSRTVHVGNDVYLSSTAVFLAEVLKLMVCVLVMLKQQHYNVGQFWRIIREEVFLRMGETLKMAVPAGLYTVQNNLLFVALSNLDAATYQVTYQLKILTTALFSVLLLRRKLSRLKWFSLLILMGGVTLVQWKKHDATLDSSHNNTMDPLNILAQSRSLSSSLIGLLAVLCACFSSGFAGVYFEKVLKTSRSSIWIRNIQLAMFGIILGLSAVLIHDSDAVSEHGFFQGYDRITWLVISLQAFGGLVVATVVKYADNILKGFATSISIVVSSIISYLFLNDFEFSRQFVVGASAVLLATFLYSRN